MENQPGSGKGSTWFFLKTRRKIRYLKHRGTLFHSTPRADRLNRRRANHLTRARRIRRRFRHLFLLIRPESLRRYNRILQTEIRAMHKMTEGIGIVTESDTLPGSPFPGKTRQYSFGERMDRSYRKMKFLLRQSKKRRGLRSTQKRTRPSIRKVRYLFHTGELFRIDLRPLLRFLYEKIRFLGKRNYLIILINSTAVFVVAYFFVFLIKELTIGLTAGSVHIKAVLMYYDVEFLIRSREWTPDMVKVVFSTGPLIMALLAIVSIIIYGLTIHRHGLFRLFILWVGCHSIAQSIGDMVFGTILNQGFGWVLAYLYYTDTDKLLFVAGLLFGMVLCGILLTRYLLLSANTYFNSIDRENRRPFVWSQILLPFLISLIIITLIKQPIRNYFDLVVVASMLILIFPGTVKARFTNDLFFDEEPRKIRLQWFWILVATAAMVLFRSFFWTGVRL